MNTQMRILIPVAGAILALGAGRSMGVYMQPQLVSGDRPGGPQVLTEWSPDQPSGPFDDGAALAKYGGRLPDYVLGTDVTHPRPIEVVRTSEPAAASRDPEPEAEPEPLVVASVDYETPAAPVRQPSIDGGAYPYGQDGPPPSADQD